MHVCRAHRPINYANPNLIDYQFMKYMLRVLRAVLCLFDLLSCVHDSHLGPSKKVARKKLLKAVKHLKYEDYIYYMNFKNFKLFHGKMYVCKCNRI